MSKLAGDESQHEFELEFENGDRMQLQCQTRAEMDKWLSVLNAAVSSPVSFFFARARENISENSQF